jgi:hypothetical protein
MWSIGHLGLCKTIFLYFLNDLEVVVILITVRFQLIFNFQYIFGKAVFCVVAFLDLKIVCFLYS